MKPIIRLVVCIAVLAGIAGNCSALVQMTLNNSGSLIQGNTYVGPYSFTVGSQSASLVCDDFNSEVWAGESWNANAYTFSDLSHTKCAAAGLQKYGEAAWLYEKGLLQPGAWGNIQYAIWAVFNPTTVEASAGWTTGSSTWLTAAQQQTFTADEFPGITIYTPTDLTSGPQEFIGGYEVPETSSSILLFGLGLVGIVAMRYGTHKCG